MPSTIPGLVRILTLSLLISPGLTAEGQIKNTLAKVDSAISEYGAWSKLSFSLGGFFAGYDSGLALGADAAGVGVVVDIEDALGIQTSNLAFRAQANYRFGKKQRSQLGLGYFSINRNATKVLEQELELGDYFYAVGTEIKSRYNFSIIRLKYTYAFLQDERVSMGATLGLFIMPLSFRLEAPGIEAQATDFVAPLPLVGLSTTVRLTPKFRLTQNTELLYIAVSGAEGSLLDLTLALDYSLSRNLDIGLGVNSNKISIRLVEDAKIINFFGDVKMSYTGLMVYAKYNLW